MPEGTDIGLHLLRESLSALKHGNYSHAKSVAEQVLDLAQANADQVLMVHAWCHAAMAQSHLPEIEKAVLFYQNALSVLQQLPTKQMSPGAATEYTDTLKFYSQRLAAESTQQDPRLRSALLRHIAEIAQSEGAYTEAEELYKQSLNLSQSLGDWSKVLEIFLLLGEVNYSARDYVDALAYFENAVEVAQTNRHAEGMARGVHGLGRVFAGLGKFAESYVYLMHALSLYESLRSPDAEVVRSQITQLRNQVGAHHWVTLDENWETYKKMLNG